MRLVEDLKFVIFKGNVLTIYLEEQTSKTIEMNQSLIETVVKKPVKTDKKKSAPHKIRK